jgi:hypothetical protein
VKVRADPSRPAQGQTTRQPRKKLVTRPRRHEPAHEVPLWRPFTVLSEGLGMSGATSTILAVEATANAAWWGRVFEAQPSQWGLRGDPYVWDAMRSAVSVQPRPLSVAELDAVLRDAFRRTVGVDVGDSSAPETILLEEFAHGGMSSGQVHVPTWRDQLLPLLLENGARELSREDEILRGSPVTSRGTGFHRPYRPRPDVDQRRLSAIRLAQAILAAPDVTLTHRRELLSIVVWKYTEADAGKWGVRYRSDGVLNRTGGVVQHEHVKPRKQIVDELLSSASAEVPGVLASSVACLVSAEEHRALGAVPPDLSGWARYEAAGVRVWDLGADPIREFDVRAASRPD